MYGGAALLLERRLFPVCGPRLCRSGLELRLVVRLFGSCLISIFDHFSTGTLPLAGSGASRSRRAAAEVTSSSGAGVLLDVNHAQLRPQKGAKANLPRNGEKVTSRVEGQVVDLGGGGPQSG